MFHCDGLRAEGAGGVEVVGGEENGGTGSTERFYLAAQHGGVVLIESGEGLVKNQALRLVDNGGDELYLLLHAIAQLGGRPVPPRPGSQSLEPFV